MKTTTQTLAISLALCLLTLSGCSVRVGYQINYEQLAAELHDHEVGKASFDSQDPLLQKRMILLCGGFNDSTAQTICQQLAYLDAQSKTEPIKLLINSRGGMGNAYLTISNMIKSIDAPVDTVNIGFCGSAGAMLIQSATGKRYAQKDTAFLIHDVKGGSKELREIYSQLQKDLYKSRCDLPEEWMSLKKDYTFTTKEALEYNFIDEVIDTIDI